MSVQLLEMEPIRGVRMSKFDPARMRQRRDKIGLSQEELAEEMKTNQTTITRYETGKRSPSAKFIGSLIKALQTNTAFLFGETDYDEPLSDRHNKALMEFVKTDRSPGSLAEIGDDNLPED